MRSIFSVCGLLALVVAHGDHDQVPIQGPHKGLWYNTLPGDGGTQVSYLECLLLHGDMAN